MARKSKKSGCQSCLGSLFIMVVVIIAVMIVVAVSKPKKEPAESAAPRYNETSTQTTSNQPSEPSETSIGSGDAGTTYSPTPNRDISSPWNALWGHWKMEGSVAIDGTAASGSGDAYFSPTTYYCVSSGGGYSVAEYFVLEEDSYEPAIAIEIYSYNSPSTIAVIVFSSDYLSAEITEYWEDGEMAGVGTMRYVDSSRSP